jgi:hypothetical protein
VDVVGCTVACFPVVDESPREIALRFRRPRASVSALLRSLTKRAICSPVFLKWLKYTIIGWLQILYDVRI